MGRPSLRLAVATALATTLFACGSDDLDVDVLEPAREAGLADHLELRRIATGLERPTLVSAAPGDRGALWVLEQPGRIVRIARGGDRDTVLDLRGRVKVGAEQGMLGLAFHPDFARNRRLFLHHSDARGDTLVHELRLDARGRARPVRRLLAQKQPEENHNGGALAFGPDGRLYLGLGDGGGAFDPRRTAQDPESKLGKLLAADVDTGEPPRWVVVASGLRNPYRFWIDPALDEIWIGDVGQDDVEEVDRFLLEPDEPPKNLGWSAFEGPDRVEGHDLDRDGDVVWPVAVYRHRDGCSITGGVVYRGARIPRLSGRYVYGDFCSGNLWTLRPTPNGRATDVRRERTRLPQLTHIGTDSDGELVLATAAGELFGAGPSVRVP